MQYNYRPPSALGRAIPVTDNIYNAAPDMGRYIDKFDISKKTGSYKQCAGKSSRSNCGCTDSQKFSGLSSYSDCIDRVSL